MKKLLLTLIILSGAFIGNAQVDSLQEYTGKYNFPEGSPVTEVSVIIENGVLTATSAIGNSELRKTDTKDVFELVAYSGLATFRRNAESKIIGIFIQVNDINMEGTKAEPEIELMR